VSWTKQHPDYTWTGLQHIRRPAILLSLAPGSAESRNADGFSHSVFGLCVMAALSLELLLKTIHTTVSIVPTIRQSGAAFSLDTASIFHRRITELFFPSLQDRKGSQIDTGFSPWIFIGQPTIFSCAVMRSSLPFRSLLL
jgi:hypothetical protein